MNMTRRPDPLARYRVKIHKYNGYRYASTQAPFVNEETGKKVYRQLHWGKVDDNMRFIPGDRYLYANPEQRKQLIFPDDWDLSELEKLSGNRKRGRQTVDTQDENRLYGDVWLLEQIARVTGLRDDLLTVFNGSEEIVDALLTLAMFLLTQGKTFNHVANWQTIEKTPCQHELSSSAITRLLQSITNQNRIDLFRLRGKRVKSDEFCAVDSTTRCAWGESLCDIQYGKSKDHLPLPQTLEVVVYTLDSHMPIYYRTFPGNFPDSRSLQTILNELHSCGLTNIILITDRGYETIQNLEEYLGKNQKMIMAAKVGQKMILDKIDDFGLYGHHPEAMKYSSENRLYYKQYDQEYSIETIRKTVKKAENLKLNLYFVPMHRCAELDVLEAAIVEQEKNLKDLLDSQAPLDDDKTVKKLFSCYKLQYDPATRKLESYTLDQKKVDKKRRTAGFFASFSNDLNMDAMEIYRHYKLRDEQEKYFNMMKDVMGADRQRNWSEDGKDGSRFILFLAHILGGYLRNVQLNMDNKNIHSTTDLLEKMRPIRYIEHPHKQPFITPFVGIQLEICEAFGFEVPKGCAPGYKVKKTNKGKRGRPRKNPVIETVND